MSRINEILNTNFIPSGEDISRILGQRAISYAQFLDLISPRSSTYLEAMAQKAQKVTQERFGKNDSALRAALCVQRVLQHLHLLPLHKR